MILKRRRAMTPNSNLAEALLDKNKLLDCICKESKEKDIEDECDDKISVSPMFMKVNQWL